LEARQQVAHALHGFDDVGAGLLLNEQQNRRLAVGGAVIAHVLHRVHYVGNVAQAHCRAIAVGQHDCAVFRCHPCLVVGANLPVAPIAFQGTFGSVGVGGCYGCAYAVQRNAVGRKFVGVDLYAHRWQCAAADIDLPDTLHLREPLGEYGRGCVVHLAARKRVGRQRQNHDRRIGWIDLAITRIAGKTRRQQAARCVDGGLHVARRTVDVAAQVELQNDVARAE